MVTYSFKCFEEDGGCGAQFSVECPMKERDKLKPTCPTCRKRKSVNTDWSESNFSFCMPPQTVGMVADRNSDRLSDDEKYNLTKKHNSYRDDSFTGEGLPSDASRYLRDAGGNILPSTKQNMTNPRKKKK